MAKIKNPKSLIKAWMAHDSYGRRRRRRGTPSGGATAATLARRPGGYDEHFSMRSSLMGVARDDELT
jgi:hypothetical protein